MKKRIYFEKSRGVNLEFKHFSEPEWEPKTRLSNLNIDFEWWEKGSKSVVWRKVKRDELVDEYLQAVAFFYGLTDSQIKILKAVYLNRKWWGIVELTDDFEIEFSGLIGIGRRMFRTVFLALAKEKKLLTRVKGKGRTRYIVDWNVLASPMEMKNCEFVMMSFKMQVDDSEEVG